MGRNILGAILGYVAMFIFIFVTFTVLYLAMGADGAFTAGGYEVTMTWIIVSTVLGFMAAVAGGYIARVVGRSSGAVKILAGIVLVLGLIMAAMIAVTPKPTETRSSATSNMEAMGKAQTPLWVAVINPFIGLIGVMLGGSLRKDRSS